MKPAQTLLRLLLGLALLGFVGAGVAHADHLGGENSCDFCKIGSPLALEPASTDVAAPIPCHSQGDAADLGAPSPGDSRAPGARAPPASLR